MYTFKAQAKQNAKRFLTNTCKVENVEAYLTQHAGSWGTWLNAEGAPVPAAVAMQGVFESLVVAAPAVVATVAAADLPTEADVAALAPQGEDKADETAAPAPSAFGAFAMSQLTASSNAAAAAAPARPAREGATPTAGLRIQKDRPAQNGIRRQSAGSVGDKLWSLYDAAGHAVTLEQAKALAVEAGLSATSAAIALYNWRKFHGIASRPVTKA